MTGLNTGNKYCCLCKNEKNVTIHHVFPKMYARYLPDRWLLKNNVIRLCRKCHDNFENKIKEWYAKIEYSVLKPHNRQQKKFFNRLRLFQRLSNDRKLYKFIVLCRYKFYEITNYELDLKIIQNNINKYDSTLKEYLQC